MLVPLYGFVEGDTMGILVLAHEDMSVAEVAERLGASARVRVTPSNSFALWAGGTRLEPSLSVKAAGLQALERVDLRRGTSHET